MAKTKALQQRPAAKISMFNNSLLYFFEIKLTQR